MRRCIKKLNSIGFLVIVGIIFSSFYSYINAESVLSPKTEEILNNSIVLRIGNNIGIVKHEKKSIDTNSNVIPVIKNGRTLLPIRFVSENLGATVSWDASTATAVIKKEDKTIQLTVGKNIMLVNDQSVTLETAPETVQDRIFIPLRALAEALDQKVYWHNRGIIILSAQEISFIEDAKKELQLELERNTAIEELPVQNENVQEKNENEENQELNDQNISETDGNDSNVKDSQDTKIKVEPVIEEKEINEKAKWIEEQVIKEIESLFPKIIVIDPPKPEPPKTNIRDLNTLVKPSIVVASINKNSSYYSSYSSKKASGKLSKGTSVEIIRDKDMEKEGHWYQIKVIDTGKMGWVLRGSLSIPADPKTNPDKMTKEEIEAYVNTKGFSSKTDYFMWVDIDRQLTHVFLGKKGEWKLARTMTCATGKNVSPTIRGTFTIASRGRWMDSAPKGDNVGIMNWVQFYGDYLFHSVIVDSSGKVKDGTQEKRASHGCIRLSLDDSIWVYDYIPAGTTVFTN